ncbi:putative oxidoreductase [Colletotrichum sublineola]|uniref:D-xylose 1-dehydrogenase (NADP(+), D-xylono-1,5-lactone-forming) n=1 Tax=Colletotrichum sublineola TaxID=1173701 RepID=A0A066XS61_COLSU|nr:putative oxidoreductase [Colletotrichum sublineola]
MLYGSYAELVRDPNVNNIYVVTPHSHHFQNAMLALDAGKHVLCEKSLTVTAEKTRVLVETLCLYTMVVSVPVKKTLPWTLVCFKITLSSCVTFGNLRKPDV